MIFRNKKNPNTMMLVGAAALLLANILHMLLRWTDGMTEAIASGAMGALYGVSFVLMLWSVRLRARGRC